MRRCAKPPRAEFAPVRIRAESERFVGESTRRPLLTTGATSGRLTYCRAAVSASCMGGWRGVPPTARENRLGECVVNGGGYGLRRETELAQTGCAEA